MEMLTVTIYADTTGLFTEEEIDCNNLIDVDFPENILRKWYEEQGLAKETAAELNKPVSEVTFEDWYTEVVWADQTDGLYQFSIDNGYIPKVEIMKTYVFYRDEYNFKDIVFEGSLLECRKFCEENNWEMDGNELEIA